MVLHPWTSEGSCQPLITVSFLANFIMGRPGLQSKEEPMFQCCGFRCVFKSSRGNPKHGRYPVPPTWGFLSHHLPTSLVLPGSPRLPLVTTTSCFSVSNQSSLIMDNSSLCGSSCTILGILTSNFI